MQNNVGNTQLHGPVGDAVLTHETARDEKVLLKVRVWKLEYWLWDGCEVTTRDDQVSSITL